MGGLDAAWGQVVGYALTRARTIDVLPRPVPKVERAPDISVLSVDRNDTNCVTG